ncbi:RAB7A-interacting MON1-CCZ1 complex subunit 1-like [Diadema antillarum]|uniref:RAB7A-interacting MON1-CCZ1 complex subunit 1-like n=1 Tax=Diadema antillarum TaxID=105358 RepID=UPI003A8A2C42
MSSLDVSELVAAFVSISELCQDMCRRYPKDQMVVLKARAVAEKYMSDLQTPDTDKIVRKALKDFTQILLDVTFLEENQLVEDEFPAEGGRARMNRLMDLYARPVDLVKSVYGDFSLPMDVLGKDYVECLHWRKGALMYMYCNTLYEQTERCEQELTHFLECLEEGVRHLESMLAVRLPTNRVQNDSPSLSSDTLSLIKQGLFSDTHVLALMYAGEMCYWHYTMLTRKRQQGNSSGQLSPAESAVPNPAPRSASDALRSSSPGGHDVTGEADHRALTKSASNMEIADVVRRGMDDVWQARHPGNRHSIHVCEGALLFDGKSVGRKMLQRYVEVVKGPLRFVGWDCSRAEQLLQLLGTQG